MDDARRVLASAVGSERVSEAHRITGQGGQEMSGMWTLIVCCLAGARRAEEIALGLRSGATAPVTLVDRLFLDLFPLARAVHVRSEASIYQDHDQARYR